MVESLSELETVAREVESVAEEFASFVAGLDETAFHRRSSADAWSAAEITGHAAEFPLLFANAAAEAGRRPGHRFGRGLDDPGRLAAVARLGNATPADGANAIRETAAAAAGIIRGIDLEATHATGTRLNGDVVTVLWILRDLVRDHLALHLAQARIESGKT